MDLRGQRFGRLLVIEKHAKSGNNQVYWRCKCDCGAETVVYQGNLRSSKTKSCGCLRVDKVNSMLARKRGEMTTPADERLFIDQLREKFGPGSVKVVESNPQYWIRVIDRLPDNGQQVVFMSENRPFWGIHRGVFFVRRDGSCVFVEGYSEIVHDVICWIPFPDFQEDESHG